MHGCGGHGLLAAIACLRWQRGSHGAGEGRLNPQTHAHRLQAAAPPRMCRRSSGISGLESARVARFRKGVEGERLLAWAAHPAKLHAHPSDPQMAMA